MRRLVLLQGLALRLHHKDIGTERFSRTIKRVLTEPSFTEVAKQLSVKLRARPRTPTQEAAGESSISHASCHARCDYNETPCSKWPPPFG
jgi:glucuronosyltransferase